MAHAIAYKAALQWLLDNDDTSWLAEYAARQSMSVTASLIADIYDKSDETVAADLAALKKRNARKRVA